MRILNHNFNQNGVESCRIYVKVCSVPTESQSVEESFFLFLSKTARA